MVYKMQFLLFPFKHVKSFLQNNRCLLLIIDFLKNGSSLASLALVILFKTNTLFIGLQVFLKVFTFFKINNVY